MLRLFLCLILLLSFANTTIAESRIALVVGNANYVHGNSLPNDLNDADDMTNILMKYGFEVTLKKDTTLSELLSTLNDFQIKLQKGGIGLFYYSGHGLEVDGQQFVIPVDAPQPKSKLELPHYMIDVNSILTTMGESKSQLNVLIFDACRDNPFSKGFGLKSFGKGFNPIVSVPNGTLIASATSAGSTSSANGARNSVYTNQLLRLLEKEPNEEIRLLLGDVSDAVKLTTNNAQVPWVSGSMSGRFYFLSESSKSNGGLDSRQINVIDKLYSTGVAKFKFGSSPEAVNNQLTVPFGNVKWESLPRAGEFTKIEARYFYRPLSEFSGLPFQDMYEQCNSDGSYLLFMFDKSGLFDISLRLSPQCHVSNRVIEQVATTYHLPINTKNHEIGFSQKGEKVQLSGTSSSNWFSVIDWSPVNSAFPPQ